MSERDFARTLWWGGKTLGIMLVNRSRQNFFLHGETLLAMTKAEGKLKLVKRRDRNAEQATPHHPGDILGRVTKQGGVVEVELIFGEQGRRIKIDRTSEEITNVVDRHRYILPTAEFDTHFRCIELMLKQERACSDLWRDSRSEIPAIYFVKEE